MVANPQPNANALGVTDLQFGEYAWTLTQHTSNDRAQDHLRATVRIAKEMWDTDPGGPCQRRALRLILEAFMLVVANDNADRRRAGQ